MSPHRATPTITLNRRESIEWAPGMTVSDLIRRMNFTFPRLVVSINGAVIPYVAYPTTDIPEGADVRVIHMMAGG